MHPYQNRIGTAPIKIKCLVPSFDNVEDVALEKLLEPQRILFPLPMEPHQEKWVKFMKKSRALRDHDLDAGWIEVGPLLPKSMMVK